MSPLKAELIKVIETAPESTIEQILTYIKTLLPESSITPDFQPETPLGKRLWQIRQKAIEEGMVLLNSTELEQELAERRGGQRDF